MMISAHNFKSLTKALGILLLPYILSACGEAQEPQTEQTDPAETTTPAPQATSTTANKPKPQTPAKPPSKPKPKSTAFGHDVLGVQLGMRQDEFEAAVKSALGNKVKLNPTTLPRNSYEASEGRVIHKQSAELKPDPNIYAFDKLDVEYSHSQATPKIISIVRSKYFKGGEFPLEANLIKQLSEKYGEPTRETTNPMAARMSGDKSWFWKLQNNKQDCGLDLNPQPSNGAEEFGNCSDILFVGMKVDRSGMVMSMVMTLADISEIAAEKVRREDLDMKQFAAHQKAIQAKAAQNTPSL